MSKVTPPKAKEFYFEGFPEPNTHQTPNILIDWILGHPEIVSDAELRVLLYLTRRICGFGKASDTVSYNQFLFGIRKKDGDILDYGCGIKSPTTLSKALQSLEVKGFIEAEKRADGRGAKVSTAYRLRFWQPPQEASAELISNRQSGGGGYYSTGSRGTTAPVVGVLQHPEIQSKVLQPKDLQGSNIRRTAQTVDNSELDRTGQTATASNGSDTHIETAPLPVRQPDSLTNGHSSTTQQDPLVTTASRGGDDIAPAERSNGLPARLDSAKRAGKAHPSHGQNKGPEQLGAILSRHSLRPEEQDARAAIESYVKDIAQECGDKAKLKSSVSRAYNLYEESGRTLQTFVDALFLARANVKERTESTTQGPIQNRMSYFFSVLEDQLGLKANGQAQRQGESATEAGSKSPQHLPPHH